MAPSNSSTDDLLRQFLATLGHLGWGLSPVMRPQPLPAQGRRAALPPGSMVSLPLPDGQLLLAVAMAVDLPAPGEAFKNYEDLSPFHRALVHHLRDHHLNARYLLLLGPAGAELLDLTDEERLVSVLSREELNERLLPLLDMQTLLRGALAAFPRKTLRQRAQELAEWTRLWGTRIGGRHDLSPGVMGRFLDWLHLARLAENLRVGPLPSPSFEELGEPGRTIMARRAIEDRFRPLHERWNLLQDPAPRYVLEVATDAARSEILASCLASFALLNRGKFSSEVFAEAFADEELRVRSWRSSVQAEGHDEDTLRSGATVTVDLDRDGTLVLLRWMDALVEAERTDALDRQSALERGERPGMQLDLLGASTTDIPVSECVRHVLRTRLRVVSAKPARVALARLLLLARACELHVKHGTPELLYPRVHADLAAGASNGSMLLREEHAPSAN